MDSVDNNVKFDIKAEKDDFDRFINAVKSVSEIAQTSHTPSDEKNHFVIYKFCLDDGKCSVVYDTKACKISLTAKADVLERFKSLYIKRDSLSASALPAKRSAQHSLPAVKNKNLPQKSAEKSKAVKAHGAAAKPVQGQSTRHGSPSADVRKQADKPAPQSKTAESAEYKNGYAIKNYERARLADLLKAVKAMRGVACKQDKTDNKGKPDEAETYIVSDKNSQKVILRYLPVKSVLQMQGKRSYLFSDIQVLVLRGTDFKSAVGSHIEHSRSEESGEKKPKSTVSTQSAVQRRLKKLLPNAFDFLGEQSKIDLAIGLVDINNNDTRLSDYSSLLTPPYRGLEKFISDLQRARGIEVKMIGQGYEKDDTGSYRLKSGYRKRIDSVVYNEVMSALYTEYFARRNFYTHSDIEGGGMPRVITDKNEVKKMFDRLIEVIDYNSKKLREIGFSLK